MRTAIRQVPGDQPIIDLDEFEQGRFWSDHWLDDPDDEAEAAIMEACPAPAETNAARPHVHGLWALLDRVFRVGGPARASRHEPVIVP